MVLAGIFVAIDRLAPSKAPDHAGTPRSDDGLSVRSILKSAAPMLRERCGKTARAALAKNGVDQSDGDIGRVIDSYCSCAIDRGVEEMSVRELLAFRLNPAAEPAASKMRDIMQKCQAAAKR